MKKLFLAAAMFLVLPGMAMAQSKPPAKAPPRQNNQLPAPKILVINRQAILQFSKVGQDIARQVQGFANKAKADMAAQSKKLQDEGQALQQQIAILAPAAKQKKIDEFQKKESALQAQAQRREQMIQGGVMKAQQQVEAVMGPILQNLMVQRGANMILDSTAVVFASSGTFNITQTAIDQLNQKLPTMKVTQQMPPSGAQAPAKK